MTTARINSQVFLDKRLLKKKNKQQTLEFSVPTSSPEKYSPTTLWGRYGETHKKYCYMSIFDFTRILGLFFTSSLLPFLETLQKNQMFLELNPTKLTFSISFAIASVIAEWQSILFVSNVNLLENRRNTE